MSKQKLMELAALPEQDYAVMLLLIGMQEPENLASDPNMKAGTMILRASMVTLAGMPDPEESVQELQEKFDAGVTKLRESCKRILDALGDDPAEAASE